MLRQLAVVCGALTLVSCKGHSSQAPDASIDGLDVSVDAMPDADGGDTSDSCGRVIIGPSGGRVDHPSGASLVVPEGALGDPSELTLCAIASPAVTDGTLVGAAFAVGPSNQVFLKPVSVEIPFDATLVPSGNDLNTIQLRRSAGAGFTALQSTVDLPHGLVATNLTGPAQLTPVQLAAGVLFITTSSPLPIATTGITYTKQLSASGGAQPYTWGLLAGSSLPPGLSLSSGGLILGIATVSDNYMFFVTVTDSFGSSVAAAVSLQVLPFLNPVPTTSAVNPGTIVQGTTSVITITGTGFAPTSVARWDGIPLPTSFVTASQLKATVSGSLVNPPGLHGLVIVNPTPGGGSSAPISVMVSAIPQNPVPVLGNVSPAFLPISTVDIQVTLNGAGFVAGSTALIGSTPLASSFISPTQLIAVVPASFLGSVTLLALRVASPAPGGGVSMTAGIQVGVPNPQPSITTIGPSSGAMGGPTFVLNVTGTSFVAGARVFFGSTALATTFVSAFALTATVTSSLLATPGPVGVIVINPIPGGGASNVLSFEVTGLCSLQPVADYPSIGAPRNVAISDFNNDGFDDVVVAQQTSNSIGVLLGNGTAFGTMTAYAAGAMAFSVGVGDFNNDGNEDVVTGDYCVGAACSMTVMLGTGTGTFGAPISYPAGTGGVSGLAVADLNGDGHLDVAVASYVDVSIMLGNGTGAFVLAASLTVRSGGYAVRDVEIDDMDADGRPDLVVTDQGCSGCGVAGVVGVFHNTGTGFAAPLLKPVGNGPLDSAIADVNSDTRPDVLVANNADGTVGVLLGNGDGTLAPMTSYVMIQSSPTQPDDLVAVRVIDFDRDGKLDVVALVGRGTQQQGVLSVQLGEGDGTFQLPTMFPTTFAVGTGAAQFAVGHFNSDSVLDYAIVNQAPNVVTIRYGTCQ